MIKYPKCEQWIKDNRCDHDGLRRECNHVLCSIHVKGHTCVTKQQALVHLISRIKNNRGFGFDKYADHCTYDKNYNGGCAIGALLPDNDAASFVGQVEHLFYRYKRYRVNFEDWESSFWDGLQRLHDTLASGGVSYRTGAWLRIINNL